MNQFETPKALPPVQNNGSQTQRVSLTAAEIPDAIQWHEGLLLTPDHFLQTSARYERLISYHAGALAPFHWGVSRFSYDKTLLTSGVLSINELEAVLPDGLIVSYDRRQDHELKLDFREDKDIKEKMRRHEVAIYLAVPTRHFDSGKGDLSRYRVVKGDLSTGLQTEENRLPIPRIRPSLHLSFTDDEQKYVSFPLLKVRFINEAFVATDFIPPCLTVARNTELWKLCDQLASTLREKALYLSEQARSPSLATGMPLLVETQIMLQSLVTPLPYFEAMLQAEAAHPHSLYLALCLLAGSIAGVGTGDLPPVFSRYEHNNLRATFTQVTSFITTVLSKAISLSYQGYPFREDGGYYKLEFDGAWKHHRLVIGLRGQSGMSERDLLEWGQSCLIGSQPQFDALRRSRILGVERKRIDREGDLIPTRGMVLFSLAADSEYLEADKVLQIFNPGPSTDAPRPSEIVLYVIKSDNTAQPSGTR